MAVNKLPFWWLKSLCQTSILQRCGIDDRVKELQDSPPAMFFYNQRTIFFVLSGALLCLISLVAGIWTEDDKADRTILVLWFFWLLAGTATFFLHPSFIRHLRKWAESTNPSRLPPLFGRYFLLDFFSVFLLIISGKSQGLNLDMFALLLVANTIVYSAYVGGGRGFSRWLPGTLYLLLILTFLLLPLSRPHILQESPRWFNGILFLGPIVGALLVSILSVTLISWLRSTENQTTQRQLELLGKYETLLAGVTDVKQSKTQEQQEFTELEYRKRVKSVLEDLCSHKAIFWYDSACFWLVKVHKDRGTLLIPGPNFNFSEVNNFRDGIAADQGFLGTEDLIIVNSIKHRHGRWQKITPRFRANLDAPAGYVPLYRGSTRIGVLALYGREGGPTPQRQDKAFLKSLGSILSNTMEQWEGRFMVFPQRDMNGLFKRESLAQVFNTVVVILQKYLMAAGCEVIFRPDPKAREMSVVAALGFGKERLQLTYEAGRGKTGECAERGITLRFDTVDSEKGFDSEYFKALEDAHEWPITSWMAIPIGPRGQNYGVIKVVNRASPWGWFTDEDQRLGEDLALRLQVLIQKFQYVEEMVKAKLDAESQAEQAKRSALQASQAQQRSELAARQRQMDLMTMTHQLQGPLNPVIGALSGLQLLPLARSVLEEIEFAKALAESCLTLCWGTSATFAKKAGQTISFSMDEIDAPSEMRRLCRMLQLTNTDNQLKFGYKEDDGFPRFQMDPSVFTSVLFSLIHNAMKYAERDSKVFLECTFERSSGEAALKVKSVGVPIYEEEKEKIFEPFERGRAVKNTNLRYNGTGLGLWVARELMLSAGGNLSLELSRAYPDLAIFVVHIPRAEHVVKPVK